MRAVEKGQGIFKFREIKFGLLMLILALIFSLISMYPSQKKFSQSGILYQGEQIDIHELLPSEELINGSITLKSDNSEVIVTSNKNTSVKTVDGEMSFKLVKSGMSFRVLKGSLKYEIDANLTAYPFSGLGYLALLFMISGSIIVNIGLLKMFSEM